MKNLTGLQFELLSISQAFKDATGNYPTTGEVCTFIAKFKPFCMHSRASVHNSLRIMIQGELISMPFQEIERRVKQSGRHIQRVIMLTTAGKQLLDSYKEYYSRLCE